MNGKIIIALFVVAVLIVVGINYSQYEEDLEWDEESPAASILIVIEKQDDGSKYNALLNIGPEGITETASFFPATTFQAELWPVDPDANYIMEVYIDARIIPGVIENATTQEIEWMASMWGTTPNPVDNDFDSYGFSTSDIFPPILTVSNIVFADIDVSLDFIYPDQYFRQLYSKDVQAGRPIKGSALNQSTFHITISATDVETSGYAYYGETSADILINVSPARTLEIVILDVDVIHSDS